MTYLKQWHHQKLTRTPTMDGIQGGDHCFQPQSQRWCREGEASKVEDCLFGPVVIDALDPFWLGADRGTNNTGELNGFAQALLFLKAQNDHDDHVLVLP